MEKKQGYKIIGIVADNYKLRAFKRQLEKHNYQYDTHPFTSGGVKFGTTLIHIQVAEGEYGKHLHIISKICKKCQIDTKLSN